jgi:hypothetical protein
MDLNPVAIFWTLFYIFHLLKSNGPASSLACPVLLDSQVIHPRQGTSYSLTLSGLTASSREQKTHHLSPSKQGLIFLDDFL